MQLPCDPLTGTAKQVSRTVDGTKREARRAGRAGDEGFGRQDLVNDDNARPAAGAMARAPSSSRTRKRLLVASGRVSAWPGTYSAVVGTVLVPTSEDFASTRKPSRELGTFSAPISAE